MICPVFHSPGIIILNLMTKNTKNILKFSTSLIIFVLSVYLAFSGVDYHKLVDALITANYFWVLVPIPIMLLSHYVRALRWRTMLEPIVKVKSVSNLFSAVMIGYFFNNLLPRGGEFIRPFIVSEKENISYSSTFATIVLERVIDLISLIFLFGLSFLLLQEKILTAFTIEVDSTSIIFISILFIVVIFTSFYPPFVEFFIKILIKPISKKVYNRVSELFVKFKKGLLIIKEPRQYIRLFFESQLIWICYALPMYFMFFSFGFHERFDLGLVDALLLVILSGVAVTIAPTPGALGVYHLMIQNSMVALYGISPEEALAYATVTHALNYFVQISVGGIYFMKENMGSTSLSKRIMEKRRNNHH